MHYVPKFPATVILCLCFLYADTVSPDYHQFTQPDGSTFWGRGYGDEFYSISETRDGYTFIHAVNSEGRSAYYYVSLDADGVFIQSELQVGIDDPDLAGISKGLRETPAVIQRKRDAVLSKFLPLNWDVTENRAGSDKYKKPLIILANFQSGGYPAGVSASFYASYTTADFGKLFFSDNLATDTFSADPGNYQTNHYDRSMKQAFLENSYNQFSLTATVSDVTAWTQAPQTYAYYCYGSQGSGGAWPHNAQGLAYDLVNLLDASVDFSQYDLDVDGIVDQIIIIVEGWTDPTGTNDDMFWSYRWSIPDAYAPVLDGVAVKGFFLTQEKMGSDGYADFNGDGFSNTQIYTQGSLRTVGTIVHEYGHSLGLPDLYDTNSGNGDSEGIGEWGLMGSGNWNSQICPASMTAWSKSELGWLTPTEISVFQDNLTVVNIEDNATAYKIPFSETEYFLIANRQRTGLDSFLNSTAGG
ncbi:MAG: M6 family metalloprotease domain-containing protein, partial [FCB group bacterium]|nr:M6 family metalloprotease domain-containing protein [FCB group bacterium]